MSTKAEFGGHSMCTPLARVMVCAPESARWNAAAEVIRWRELGFQEMPDCAAAQKEHEELCLALAEAGAEVLFWRPGRESQVTLDSVYVHDPSLITNRGAILLRMGKTSRGAEPSGHAEFYASCGIAIAGSIRPPGKVEGGDLVWLDERTLLAGVGYRTNLHGLDQLRELLRPEKVDVIPAPLPHGGGPAFCLHLMSLMSVLDDRTLLVDQPWISVQTVEFLQEMGFRNVEIDPLERDTLACNVLSLGGRRLLAFRENQATVRRLEREGFSVRTIPGLHVGIHGGGGPTCLTRPLLRRAHEGPGNK